MGVLASGVLTDRERSVGSGVWGSTGAARSGRGACAALGLVGWVQALPWVAPEAERPPAAALAVPAPEAEPAGASGELGAAAAAVGTAWPCCSSAAPTRPPSSCSCSCPAFARCELSLAGPWPSGMSFDWGGVSLARCSSR